MPRPVYSKLFLAVLGPTLTDTFIVPAGFTAVLRDMTLWCGADHPTGFATVAFHVALDTAGMFVWTEEGSTMTRGLYQWSGREVFSTFLQWQTVMSTYAFRASGYLLSAT